MRAAILEPRDLPEKIEEINEWLIKEYGKFEGYPIWRVVWSEIQFEMRRGVFNYFDNNGNFVRTETGVFEVPKYRQWIKEKFVLERILPVPDCDSQELTTKLSYEPIFPFADKNDNYLHPRIDVCKIVIEAIMEKAAKTVGIKREKDPESTQEEALLAKKQRVDEIMEELFGNETDTCDALRYKQGIVVPGGKL